MSEIADSVNPQHQQRTDVTFPTLPISINLETRGECDVDCEADR